MHVAAKYIFIILMEKQIFCCNLEVLYQGTQKKKKTACNDEDEGAAEFCVLQIIFQDYHL